MKRYFDTLPDLAKPKKQRKTFPEDALQIAAINHIRLMYPYILAIHPANERKCSPQAGARLKAKGVLAGTPDILLWWKLHEGMQAGAIELKVGKNTLSEAQIAWRDKFEACGGKWALCRSIDDVRDWLNQWGVIPSGR
jgi:hypothetical protein